eukprot:Awhi_evm1s4304
MKLFGILSLTLGIGAQGLKELFQNDFDDGTFLIDKPGLYVLKEDVFFNPNSRDYLREFYNKPELRAADASWVRPDQFRKYDPKAFGIGFFTAIAVRTRDVIIDLNGHTLSQSKEHALQMRFFSLIELNSSPFLGHRGPHSFVGEFGLDIAKNVTIQNGHLGLTAHHGIHGNDNENIFIKNMTFEDYEIAAIHINGGKRIEIRDCKLLGVREDVPILGTFSAGRFIKRYVDYMVKNDSPYTLRVQAEEITAQQVHDDLADHLDAVYEDLIVKGKKYINEEAHPKAYAIFHNKFGLPDGNNYGILLNRHDEAINGFGSLKPGDVNFASHIKIENVTIKNTKVWVNEIVGLCNNPVLCDLAQADTVGSVLQLLNLDPSSIEPITISSLDMSTAKYIGNAISNAQILVGKAALDFEFKPSHMSWTRNSIQPSTLEWVENQETLAVMFEKTTSFGMPGRFVCNGDTMFHVNKGVAAVRIDGIKNMKVENLTIAVVENAGSIGTTICNHPMMGYTMHPKDSYPGGIYGGAHARGVALISSSNVSFKNVKITKVKTAAGPAIGFDLMFVLKKMRTRAS